MKNIRFFRAIKNESGRRGSFLVAATEVKENNFVESISGSFQMTAFNGKRTNAPISDVALCGFFTIDKYSFKEVKKPKLSKEFRAFLSKGNYWK